MAEKFDREKHVALWDEMHDRAKEFADKFRVLKVVQDDLKTSVFLREFKRKIIEENWEESGIKNSCYACKYAVSLMDVFETTCSCCPLFVDENVCKEEDSPWQRLKAALFQYSQNGKGLADIEAICEEIRDYPLNIDVVIKDLEKECDVTIRKEAGGWELEFYSNAGEDCVFNIVNTDKENEVAGLVKGLYDVFQDFDPEENVMTWLERKRAGDKSVPDVFVLTEDAKWIEDKLEKISVAAGSRWG